MITFNKISRLRALTLPFIFLLLVGTEAIAKEIVAIDELFKKGSNIDVKTLFHAAKKAPVDSRDLYLAVGMELNGHRKELIELLEPKIANNRKQAHENPPLTCMLAYAYARESKPESAKRTLDLIANLQNDDLALADINVVTGHLNLSLSQLEDARKSLDLARKHYSSAVSSPDYVTWHSRLIERRMKLLDGALTRKKPKPESEPQGPLDAWLAADKAGTQASYAKIIEVYPNTLYANAAELAAARLHLQNDDPKSCLKALKSSPLLEGELADLAWIAIGDAMIIDGQSASEAGEAYTQAIAVLGKTSRPKTDLDEKAKAALLPAGALHSLKSGFPEWQARSPGQILLSTQDPRLLAYNRYQTVVKSSALAYAEGKRGSAGSLARSLLMFDPVDRKMGEDRAGSGGLILERGWTENEFLCPLGCIDGARPEIRNTILVAVGFYQVYDFESTSWWLSKAIKMKAKNQKDRLAHEFAVAVQAYNLSVLNRVDEAMKMAASVVLMKGNDAAAGPWMLAKSLQATIHMDESPRNADASLKVLQEMVDRGPKNSQSRKVAMMGQCTISTYYKIEATESYIQEFQKQWPSETKIAEALINTFKNQKSKQPLN